MCLCQILAFLPPIEGTTVLEFGAGIGRFTTELAQKAGQVIAVDFIESVIKKVVSSRPCLFFLATYKTCIFLEFCLIFFSNESFISRMRTLTVTTRTSNFCALMSHHQI